MQELADYADKNKVDIGEEDDAEADKEIADFLKECSETAASGGVVKRSVSGKASDAEVHTQK